MYQPNARKLSSGTRWSKKNCILVHNSSCATIIKCASYSPYLSKERGIFRRNNSMMPRMPRYGTPRNSKDVLPEIHSTSGRICSPRGKRVRLAAGAVSNFADATSCVHVRVFHRRPADAHVHATVQKYGSPDASFQHAVLRPACLCCTMEDLGHPKTVAGAVPREFLVSLLGKIMRAGERIAFVKRLS